MYSVEAAARTTDVHVAQHLAHRHRHLGAGRHAKADNLAAGLEARLCRLRRHLAAGAVDDGVEVRALGALLGQQLADRLGPLGILVHGAARGAQLHGPRHLGVAAASDEDASAGCHRELQSQQRHAAADARDEQRLATRQLCLGEECSAVPLA